MLCRNSTAFTRCLLRSWTENERGFSRCCVRWQNKEVVESSDKGRELQKSLKPKRPKPPFIKNLFLGKFDKELLSYPELKDNAELEELNAMVDPIEKFFQNLDSKSIDVNAVIPPETLKQLGELGLFGQQIPEEYGGLGLNATKYARLGEITALDGGVAVTLAAHQAIGLKGILIVGTDAQKQQYLPALATGERVAAFCLTEPGSGSDAASIQTRATLSEDGTHYLLTGNKIWISNGGIADVFTVFAKTEITDPLGEKSDKVTAFIVERSFGGVTHGKAEDKLGIRGSNTTELHFDATPVPTCNVLGDVGSGFKLAMNILNSGRFSMGSSGAGVLKNLIAMTAEHAVTRKQFGKSLAEFDLIKQKFAKMSVSCYAMESMAYLTAGMLDSGERPDCSLEAAIVKIFSSEACWVSVSECLQVMGGQGYIKDYAFERYLRDCRILLIFEGTNEILRLFIALSGLQHAGADLMVTARKVRNPLANPWFTWGKIIERWSQSRGKPKMSLHLKEEVHQSLELPAQALEWSVHRFKFAVEVVLQRHGKSVIDQQMELARLTDIAIDIYAMTAVLSRASRSLCIGLKSLDHELLLARAFCVEAHQRVDNNIKDLMKGMFLTNDETYRRIAKDVFKERGYVADHPLSRNY